MIQQKQKTNKHIIRSIEKLTTYRNNLQQSINDYLNTLLLNRQLKPKDQSSRKELTDLLSISNPIFPQIQQLRKNQESQQAELLMQQQITDEQLLFNTEILNSNLEQIDDMRKLMHDKEFSYSQIVQKLNQFQQLPEQDIRTTSSSIQMIISQKNNRQLLARVSNQKYKLEEKIKEVRQEKQKYKSKYKQMIQLIRNNAPYDKIINFFEKEKKEVLSEDEDACVDESKPKTQHNPDNMMHNDVKANPKLLHRQFMKLLKKQFSLTELYKYQLLQSNEVTKEVKLFNKELLKDQRYLDKNLKYYHDKLKILEAKYKNYTHGTKIDHELMYLDIQKPVESSENDSQIEVKEEEDDRIKLNGENVMRAMMIRSGSEPKLPYSPI